MRQTYAPPKESSSRETEIRLAVPADGAAKIDDHLRTLGGIRRQTLRAVYLDTPDFQLARHGIGLRLRRERGRWIQTIKVDTPNHLTRIEHQIIVSGASSDLPEWSSDHIRALQSADGSIRWPGKLDIAAIAPRFEIVVKRRSVVVATREGSVELSYDVGQISRHGEQGTGAPPLHVCELEIERCSGRPRVVLLMAARMIRRFRLSVETRSKAERGVMLARGNTLNTPVRAFSPKMDMRWSDQHIVHSIIGSCCDQILRNQSTLISHGMDEDVLHQLRVGLRRLRSAIKLLGDQCAGLSEAEIHTLSTVFRHLGRYRDRNFIEKKLNPALRMAGGPGVCLGVHTELPDPAERLRDMDFQLLLLAIMGMSMQPGPTLLDTRTLPGQFDEKLTRIHGRQQRQARDFQALSDAERHDIRKKLKFLRYCMEFLRDLYPKTRYERHRKQLAVTLEHLGDYQDICTAIEMIAPGAGQDASGSFALGWLKAEQRRMLTVCHESLKALFAERLPTIGHR
jgi:triphosphatase